MPLRHLPVLLWLLLVTAACAADGHVVRWETASEVNTAGFNLYRGPTAGGPWERVNATLIPSTAEGVSGGRYQFRDRSADPAMTYYYRLEEVELDGTTRAYDPVVSPGLERRWAWWLWVAIGVAAIGLGWWLGGRPALQKRRRP
jgi:hypothetical protein